MDQHNKENSRRVYGEKSHESMLYRPQIIPCTDKNQADKPDEEPYNQIWR